MITETVSCVANLSYKVLKISFSLETINVAPRKSAIKRAQAQNAVKVGSRGEIRQIGKGSFDPRFGTLRVSPAIYYSIDHFSKEKKIRALGHNELNKTEEIEPVLIDEQTDVIQMPPLR